jgi:hypothetical protein
VGPEGLSKLEKNKKFASLGLEPATFRRVPEPLRYRMPGKCVTVFEEDTTLKEGHQHESKAMEELMP